MYSIREEDDPSQFASPSPPKVMVASPTAVYNTSVFDENNTTKENRSLSPRSGGFAAPQRRKKKHSPLNSKKPAEQPKQTYAFDETRSEEYVSFPLSRNDSEEAFPFLKRTISAASSTVCSAVSAFTEEDLLLRATRATRAMTENANGTKPQTDISHEEKTEKAKPEKSITFAETAKKEVTPRRACSKSCDTTGSSSVTTKNSRRSRRGRSRTCRRGQINAVEKPSKVKTSKIQPDADASTEASSEASIEYNTTKEKEYGDDSPTDKIYNFFSPYSPKLARWLSCSPHQDDLLMQIRLCSSDRADMMKNIGTDKVPFENEVYEFTEKIFAPNKPRKEQASEVANICRDNLAELKKKDDRLGKARNLKMHTERKRFDEQHF